MGDKLNDNRFDSVHIVLPPSTRQLLGYLLGYLIAVLMIAGVVRDGLEKTQAGEDPITTLSPSSVSIVSTMIWPSAQPSIQLTVQPTVQPTIQPTIRPTIKPTAKPFIPDLLIAPGLSLKAGPVDVPLELRIPSLWLNAPVLGVGITSQNVMNAPYGPNDDPIWQKAFWYRGSGTPGDLGTATFAGHVTDGVGRPAVFSRIKELKIGDWIIIHDTRNGREVLFIITETKSYSYKEALDPQVLKQVYGSGPVAGNGAEPASDRLSHLTLITCNGDFVAGGFEQRLVVYATRSK